MNNPSGTTLGVPSSTLKKSVLKEATASDSLSFDEVRKSAEEQLYCALSGTSFFDKSEPILGYPLDIRSDQFGNYWATPVVQMISYDAFIKQISENPEKKKDFENVRFRSSFGDSYNFWIPVYINEEHWKAASKQTRFSIMVARTGFSSSNLDGFKPKMAVKVLTGILNKIASQILQDKPEQSRAAIQAFSHFYHLLKRFLIKYPKLQEDIDELVESAKATEESRSKQAIGDMGEFFIKLSLSEYGLQNTSLNLMLFEEYLARQVGWLLKADPKFLQQEWSLLSFVKAFIGQSRMSHQTLAVLLETLKLVIANLHNDFSVLPTQTIEAHLKKVSSIRQKVAVNGNWEALLSYLGLDSLIQKEEDMAKVIQKAFEISAKQSYNLHTMIPSFQNARKKYEAIPFNPNFTFKQVSSLNAVNGSTKDPSTNKQQTTTTSTTVTTKTSAIMSTATWEEKKTDLKGFESSSTIVGILPTKKPTYYSNNNNGQSSNANRGPNKKSGPSKYEKVVYYVKKDGKSEAAQINKSDTDSNSTAENSMIQDFESLGRGFKQQKKEKMSSNDKLFFNFGKTTKKLNSEGKGNSRGHYTKAKW